MSSTPQDPSRQGRSETDNIFSVEQSQSEFEIEFFGRLVQRSPEYVDAIRIQAELLARSGNYEKSLQLYRRLIRLRPDNSVVHYNYACSLSMVAMIDESMDALLEAVRLGYDDFAHLETDPDLDAVRTHPAYEKLLREQGLA